MMYSLPLREEAPLSKLTKGSNSKLALDTLILKVASRCNLNCSYCYMYNLADSGWKLQPKFMSNETVALVIERWRSHLIDKNPPARLHLILHGGEPLLAGPERFDHWITLIRRDLCKAGIPVSIGIQSNGLLLNDELCEVLCRHGVRVGISIDGIPGKGDQFRVDHNGVPSGRRLEDKLLWLADSPWAACFGGMLSVVNIESDPIETLEYILKFSPARLDFRLPLCNHDSPPARPIWDFDKSSYGRWLARVFDYVVDRDVQTQVRILDAVINSGINPDAYQNMIGNTELTQACVIETDGTYELVDNLKSIKDGMTRTGMSVRTDSLDDYCAFAAGWRKHHGLENLSSLANTCLECELYSQCNGFFYAHRYSSSTLFSNESVYCSDVRFLFNHVNRRLKGGD